MPKVKISEYSATANSNTDVASINIDEGCAPSGINNAIRAVMGHLKDFQQGTYGDPFNGPVNGTLGATTASTANVTTLTTSSTVTHNGGTANGVAYLNGSKVLTTGSALVFDGTNLGVGVTPSTTVFSGSKMLQVGFAPNVIQGITSGNFSMIQGAFFNSAGNMQSLGTGLKNTLYSQTDGSHQWFNAPVTSAGSSVTFTQAMTLDDSGNLLVGTTSVLFGSAKLGVSSAGNGSGFIHTGSTANTYVPIIAQRTASVGDFAQFVNQSGSTAIGWITTANNTTVTYNSASDYRLKENIQPMTGALAKVALLKPVTYKWKSNGVEGEGFIAHELSEVCPEAVSGKKDAVDADGNPKYQGIDTSLLIATLTAAIQEQQALITQLQADVALLKGA